MRLLPLFISNAVGIAPGPGSPRPKYVRCARSSADAFCPSGGGADAVWRCADPLGMRSNLRERARTMALSGGVGGSSLGCAAVGLQHLKGDSAIRFTHKIRQRAVISCMINLHTLLVWRTMWGELVEFIVITLETVILVFGTFSIICDDIQSSMVMVKERRLKSRLGLGFGVNVSLFLLD